MGDVFVQPKASMKNMYTPWGFSQHVTAISPDQNIVLVETASHGGIGVRRELPMPAHLDIPRDSENQEWRWYEEDSAVACVALAFPQFFKKEALESATKIILNDYPAIYEAHFGRKPTADESRAVYEAELNERLKNNFRVKSAFGDWAWDVPKGFTYVLGYRLRDMAEDGFLVPSAEYEASKPNELILDNYPRFKANTDLPYSKPVLQATSA
jgi:hypothetical protein